MINYKDRIDFAAVIRMACDLYDRDYYHDYARVLYAQAQLESGNFNSNIYRNGNNLFGMKGAVKRGKYWKDILSGHARYQHRFISIMDRIDWDIWNGIYFTGDAKTYMEKVVKKGYAEDKDYLTKWLKLYNNE